MVGKRQMRCVIIDDEPLARVGLRNYIHKTDNLILCGEYRNPVEFEEFRGTSEIDLMFLDIQMPFQKGTDYLQVAVNPPLVIITSAHGEYALQGYELNIVDYLLKPFSYKRFQDAVTKAQTLAEARQLQDEGHIFVKDNRALTRLYIKNIKYVQAMENYVVFHTTGKKYIVKSTLQKTLESLKPHGFEQIHKSFIVNSGHILQIIGNEVEMSGVRISISRNFRKSLLERMHSKK